MIAAKTRQVDRSQPLFIELGRSFNDGRGQSVDVGVGTTPQACPDLQSPRANPTNKTGADAIYCDGSL